MPPTDRNLPPWIWPRAAYVHVPFCAHRCGYCDFTIAVGQDGSIDRYLDALAAELTTLGSPQPVETLHIGGGTPSYLDGHRLDRLFDLLDRWLPRTGAEPEVTLEANPDDLHPDKVALLADRGVNRISLGVQSFQPELLAVLDRRHRPADVPRAVEAIRRRMDRVSFDLIFGAPGQTFESWQDDVNQALALRPDHVSTYGLTYEKGTRLWKQRLKGVVQPIEEELELALYSCGIDMLEAAGFEHYEISNFARPGGRSRHNQVYWANEAYFGFGVGAARYVEGCRSVNTRSLPKYLRQTLVGASATCDCETLPPWERARETMAVQLRRSDGIARQRFLEQTGFHLDDVAGDRIERMVDFGLLEASSRTVRLTRLGRYVADCVIEHLLR